MTRHEQSATIVDVARLAGVSKATVSKALHARSGDCEISQTTRDRVIAAAATLGYRADWRKSARARKRSCNIGLVYARSAPFTWGVYEGFVESLADVLTALGYSLLFVPAAGELADWRKRLMDQRLDGCVVCDPMPQHLDAFLAVAKLPAVLVNQVSPLSVPQVRADDRLGARLLVDHLVELGHREIAYAEAARSGQHGSEMERRLGYQQAMTDRGLAPRLYRGETAQVARQLAKSDRPSAVIIYNHADTLEMLAIWRALAVRIPQDLSVACFDDVLALRTALPPITSIRVPLSEMGARAGALVVDLVEGRRSPTAAVELMIETLIVRESTGKPRRRR